jgi:hypothetical protein
MVKFGFIGCGNISRFHFNGIEKAGFFPAVVKGKELMPHLGRIISAQVRSYQAWGNFYSTMKNMGDYYFCRT